DGDGTYEVTVRASDGSLNDDQLITVNVTDVVETPPMALTTLDLLASSDSGSSSSDDITNDTTPTLRASFADGAVGTVVEVYNGASLVGTVTLTAADVTNGYVDITASDLGVDGVKTLTASSTDASGTPTLDITLDTTPPPVSASVTIDLNASSDTGSSSTDNYTADDTPGLSGTYSATSGASVVIKIYDGSTYLGTANASGGSWSFNSPHLNDGSHTLKAVVTATKTDSAGNTGSATGTASTGVTIDTVAPNVSVSDKSVPEGSSTTLTVTGVSGSDTVVAGSGSDQSHFSFNGSSFSFGSHDFENPTDSNLNNTYIGQVRATDLAGNTGTDSFTVTVTNVTPSNPSSSGGVKEDVTLSVSKTISSSEPGGETWLSGSFTGTYGTLSLSSSGAWTYNLNNSSSVVQNLNDTDNVKDIFTVTSSNGLNGTITINVNGTIEPEHEPEIVSRSFVFADSLENHKKQFGYLTVNDVDGDNIGLSYLGINADADSGTPPWVGFGSQIRVDADTVRFAVQAASSINTIGTGTIGWKATDETGKTDTAWMSVQWDYVLESFKSALPIVLDLDGDGFDLVAISDSNAWYDMDGDGAVERTGWVGADDGILAYDRDGNGAIAGENEISFLDDLAGATTDLEGLAGFDTNGNGQFDSGDDAFANFVVWVDADGDGVSTASELTSLTDMGIVAIDLGLTSTGQTASDDGNNAVLNTADVIWSDSSVSSAGDVALAYQNMTNVILVDLDGDGISTSFAAASGVTFDMDGNGTADQTDWMVAGDGILVADRNGNGTVDDVSELVFTGDGSGTDSQLMGLLAFDTNSDGLLNSSDAGYGELFIWQDANLDGISQAGELLTLAEAGLLELDISNLQNEDTYLTMLTGDENNPVIALVQVGLVYEDGV
ncbi:beta strand repeat-containing protein, partial [Kordiimonas sp. UBA4487]